jgi:hypothetical protein
MKKTVKVFRKELDLIKDIGFRDDVINILNNAPELDLIKDIGFRDDVINILNNAPDYITTIPSASTGKHHPRDEINPMGMIYHVKRCAIMAQQISNIRRHTQDETDILVASCILHDLIKNGNPKGEWTVKNHEILAYQEIHKYYEDYVLACADDPDYSLTEVWKNKLFLTSVCVLLHSGQWTPTNALAEYKNICTNIRFDDSDKKLFESFHMTDYIVSRRAVADMFQEKWCEDIKEDM